MNHEYNVSHVLATLLQSPDINPIDRNLNKNEEKEYSIEIINKKILKKISRLLDIFEILAA